ncbi:hypothetical protein ACFLT9_06235 [Acidobacteriota bacterium]
MTSRTKAKLYKKYPISSILIYNGVTVVHFLLGGWGLWSGYGFTDLALAFSISYMVFAFVEMYVLMPLVVCPRCPYVKMEDSVCISGLNLVSKRITQSGDIKEFAKRGEGLFCPNNLYIASLAVPIMALIPALILDFSFFTLLILVGLISLLIFRFFVIFPKISCVHCYAKFKCPQAGAMGVREL